MSDNNRVGKQIFSVSIGMCSKNAKLHETRHDYDLRGSIVLAMIKNEALMMIITKAVQRSLQSVSVYDLMRIFRAIASQFGK